MDQKMSESRDSSINFNFLGFFLHPGIRCPIQFDNYNIVFGDILGNLSPAARLVHAPTIDTIPQHKLQDHIKPVFIISIFFISFSYFTLWYCFIRTMLLLSVVNFQLYDFPNDPPPYATLSYTPDAKDVRFEDLWNHTLSSEETCFGHIRQACIQVRNLGALWIWSDSLCIDTRSSTSLSESFNSLGQIYRDCRFCVVYLRDFPPGVICEEERGLYLTNCTWARNTWTLPHVIFPRVSYFFDSDWTQIGTKSTLSSQLARIFSMEKRVLEDCNTLDDYSAATKIAWAAGLFAPQIEDTAYSLISLFKIKMPVLYGEGRAAFIRLQTEIIKETNDLSLCIWDYFEDQTCRGVFARSPTELSRRSRNGPWKPSRIKGEISISGDTMSIRANFQRSGSFFLLPVYCEDGSTCLIPLLDAGQYCVRTSAEILYDVQGSLESNLETKYARLDLSSSEGEVIKRSWQQGAKSNYRPSQSKWIPGIGHLQTCAISNRFPHIDKQTLSCEHLNNHGSSKPSGRMVSGARLIAVKPTTGPSRDGQLKTITATSIAIVPTRSETLGSRDGEESSGHKTTNPSEFSPAQQFSDTTNELTDIMIREFHLTLEKRPAKRPGAPMINKESKRTRVADSGAYISSGNFSYPVSHNTGSIVVQHSQTGPVDTIACPFYLMDKDKYHTCLTRHKFLCMEDLKQHLYTEHRQPVFCPICRQTFPTYSAQNVHLRAGGCHLRDGPVFQGMTDEQVDQVSAVRDRPLSAGDGWFDIWDIVFPGTTHPTSPWYAEAHELVVVHLRRFWEREGHRIIGEVMKRNNLQRYEIQNEERNLTWLYHAVLDRAVDKVLASMKLRGDSFGNGPCKSIQTQE